MSLATVVHPGPLEPLRTGRECCGFHTIAQRPIVKDGWENPGKNWVLLVK